MRYGGNFLANLSVAIEHKDKRVLHDLITDQLGSIIKQHPDKVIEALKESGVQVSSSPSKRRLVSLVVDNLYGNEKFANEISSLIAQYSVMESNQDFSNAIGAAISSALAGVSQAVGALVSGSQQNKSAQTQLEMQKEATRRAIYEKLGARERTNFMPIVVIGGVLLIGGIVLVTVIKNRK